VNHLINIVHSSNKSLVYEASRALAHICGAPNLARTLNEMHVTEAVVNLIQDSSELRNRCGLIILNGLVGSSHDVSRVSVFHIG